MTYQAEVNDSRLTRKTSQKIRVLIVNNQHLHGQLIQISLGSEADIKVVGLAKDGETALKLGKKLHPDIALVNWELPGIDSLKTTQMLCQSLPSTKVIILTSQEQQKDIEQAFEVGAKGYLQKNITSQDLASAIRFVERNYIQFGEGLFKPTEPEVSQLVKSDYSYENIGSDQVQQVASKEIVSLSPNKLASSPEDDWSMTTKDLLDALPYVWTRGLLYVLLIFTAFILPWSILFKVDETGMARGKLEPKEKTVQLDAPVAGTVAAIKVKEGDSVKAQQILLELESEVIRADLQQLEEKQTGQLNRLTQLELLHNQLSLALRTQEQQIKAQELEKQAQVKQARQHLNGLKTLYLTQKAEKLAQIEQFQEAINVRNAAVRLAKVSLLAARDKTSRYSKAFEDGIIPEDRLRDVEQQADENQERLAQANAELEQSRFRLKEQQRNYDKLIKQTESEIEQANLRLQEQERSYQSVIHSGKLALLKTEEQLKNLETQIGDLNSEIAQTKSQIASLNYQLTQRVVKAPISGTVFHLPISGAGAVLQSGENIVKIAPQSSPLVLKAYMTPTESGFLRVGMPVKIKYDAYPFQDYGVQTGRVSWIAPDSKITETERGKQETFELKIELEQSYIEGKNKRIVLTPGQTATAEVIIRQRRLIDFVLDPFKKLQEGGLEL